MQVSQGLSYHLPQYQSAILKKDRESKILSPKVTHVHPQISSIQKIKLKKHHLDDTEMKLALQYDYEDPNQPKQYLFKGNRIDFDKRDYNNISGKTNNRKVNSHRKTSVASATNLFAEKPQTNLKLNTEYFDTGNQFNSFPKPSSDQIHYHNQQNPQNPSFKHYQNPNSSNQPSYRLKKSISVTDFQSLKKDQHQLEHKVITKLNQIQNQTDRINRSIEHLENTQERERFFRQQRQDQRQRQYQKQQKQANQQKSASHLIKKDTDIHKNDPLIVKYKSQHKGSSSSAEKKFNKLKEKLEKQRSKEKIRLETELIKIKQETKRIKEQEKRRKKSFKELIEKGHNSIPNSKYLENLMLSAAGSNPNNHIAPFNTMRSNQINYASTGQSRQHQQNNILGEKFHQLERKYFPKTNIVNKRIQCELYDPRSDHVRRLMDKPKFVYKDDTDTDSQFSDF